MEILGTCEPAWEPVKRAFEENFRQGLELGASLAITGEDGQLLCDLWGGFSDREKTQPWHQDNLCIVFSTTKYVTTLCILKLADEGLLGLDDAIADHWPEFATAGKDKITIRQLLSHSAGMPGWDEVFSPSRLADREYVVSLLQQQAPWYEPGTISAYHMLTFGYLAGELVRRVAGLSLRDYFRARIGDPLNIDFHIGLPDEMSQRRVQLQWGEARDWSEMYDDAPLLERVDLSPDPAETFHWTSKAFLQAEIPSANGWGNARSIAQLGAILANDGLIQGTQMLSPELVREAVTEQRYELDHVLGMKWRWGLGVWLSSESFSFVHDNVALAAGAGGNFMYMDRQARVAISYVPNFMYGDIWDDAREVRIKDAFDQCLAKLG